ncbi:GNAT family N-acetyltransferase [Flexivirga caeni]|uniref:GNAT family N-acetyltransferase n=1 Tax=Flexivirga caeni TaxID=2294115 RepID=UPI0013159DD2|nr:GNAT family N-acetyltransferase [Flexivirga caeni]
MSEQPGQIGIARCADRNDALAMAALNLRWDRDGGAPPRTGFLDEFADAWSSDADHYPAWLARRADGDPVGFAVGVVARSLPSLRHGAGGWLHLSRLFVVPDLQGQGVGARLLDTVIRWSVDSGLYRVQLNATDQARAFYRRAGFGSPQDTLMQLVLTDRLPGS